MSIDPSVDYASYPTLAPLPDGTPSASAFVFCPVCGGIGFRLRRIDRAPVCMACEYILEPEYTPQEAGKTYQNPENTVHQDEPRNSQTTVPSYIPVTSTAHTAKFQIVRGPDHTVILRPDGTVKAVGSNKNGQCNVHDWKSITAVATNQFYTIGLCKDGTVKAAGGNFLFRNKLNDWKNVTSIAAGDNFVVARCADGTVKSAGIRLPVWSGISAVAAGGSHVAALCDDGSVRAVGSPAYACKVQDWSRIKAIALGGLHTVALCDDGTVKAIGYNKKSKREPTPRCTVDKWTRIAAIAAGENHTVALHEGGWVFAVGDNSSGQCDVSEWNNVVAICAGETFTAALCADGTILCTDPAVHKLLDEIYT